MSADPADPIPPLAVDDLQHGWLEEADVVVVGLGAAGLAASLELRAAT